METKVEGKHIGAGLGALGVLALAVSGYVNITTPEAQQCAVDLAAAQARLELIEEAKESLKEATASCKSALKSCAGASP
jgi:16S rRNA G1207 methylase RsmC